MWPFTIRLRCRSASVQQVLWWISRNPRPSTTILVALVETLSLASQQQQAEVAMHSAHHLRLHRVTSEMSPRGTFRPSKSQILTVERLGAALQVTLKEITWLKRQRWCLLKWHGACRKIALKCAQVLVAACKNHGKSGSFNPSIVSMLLWCEIISMNSPWNVSRNPWLRSSTQLFQICLWDNHLPTFQQTCKFKRRRQLKRCRKPLSASLTSP